MEPIEIIVIIASVLIVGGVIVKSIIDRKKGKNSCCSDCRNCSTCKSCKSRVNNNQK